MPRRGPSARAAALRRAQQAKAARDADRLRREKDIEAALADYFQATEQAGRIRAEGRRKADQLLTGADRAAHPPEQSAAAAVRRLRDLVGSAAEVAALCGIATSSVRAMIAESARQPGPAVGTAQRAGSEGPVDAMPVRDLPAPPVSDQPGTAAVNPDSSWPGGGEPPDVTGPGERAGRD